MNVPPIVSRLQAGFQTRRWQISGGVSIVLVALLIAGFFILRQHAQATPTGASSTACTSTATAGMVPPGVTLPVTIPAGEPRVVATVNGVPLCADALEVRVQGTLANHRQLLQQLQQSPVGGPSGPPPTSLPPNILASLKDTPNQVRHDALTLMIQEQLLYQQGKRLGLTASMSAAQAMARQTIQTFEQMPASSPGYAGFDTYLRENHLTVQTFPTDPRVLQGYVVVLTIAAMRQHIQKGLPPNVAPTAGINAYAQHLWQTGNVHVYLPAQLGW